MKKRLLVVRGLITGLTLCLLPVDVIAQDRPRTSSVEESSLAVSPLLGYLQGHSLYHISYYEGPSGIESELEFPLNSSMAGVSGEYTFADYRDRREWKVRVTVLKDIGDVSGVLKDSDWLTDDLDIQEVGQAHPGKDIYSESAVALDATIFDLTAVYNTIREDRVNIGPLVRFLYENFKFTASNTNQVGYGPYAPAYTAYIPHKTLDYEVTYKILALGVSCEYPAYQKFRANVQLAYSPWAVADDIDDHVLRSKRSTGSTDGSAFLVLFGLTWDVRPDMMLTMGGEYRSIRTTGTQRQYFYAGPDAGLTFSVNDRIDSTQVFVSAMLTFLFPQ